MRHIRNTPNLGRSYRVTDELCDLSTMAMEYFKDKIEPTLPEITFFGSDFLDFTTPYTSMRIKLLFFVFLDVFMCFLVCSSQQASHAVRRLRRRLPLLLPGLGGRVLLLRALVRRWLLPAGGRAGAGNQRRRRCRRQRRLRHGAEEAGAQDGAGRQEVRRPGRGGQGGPQDVQGKD